MWGAVHLHFMCHVHRLLHGARIQSPVLMTMQQALSMQSSLQPPTSSTNDLPSWTRLTHFLLSPSSPWIVSNFKDRYSQACLNNTRVQALSSTVDYSKHSQRLVLLWINFTWFKQQYIILLSIGFLRNSNKTLHLSYSEVILSGFERFAYIVNFSTTDLEIRN